MIPRVVDVSHHNVVTDFAGIAKAGVWGMIHKATQGAAYRDPKYNARYTGSAEAGLLFGAYHFNTGDPVVDQVNNFLNYAKITSGMLAVLDYEENRLSNMSISQAAEFLHRVEDELGRKAAIYSGNRLKETISKASAKDRDYIRQHRLWLAQYGKRAVLPAGFSKWWLWQYTGDGVGQLPHKIDGVQGDGIDLNAFDGTQEELKAQWA